MQTPYAPKVMLSAWVVAGWAGIAYGLLITILAFRLPPGMELAGDRPTQPLFKASMALLLALAAAAHPIVRERRWLMPALLFSALGDGLLAIPWWPDSFVLGLGAFLMAHVCFLGALVPLARGSSWPRRRLVAAAGLCVACVGLLALFWPQLGLEGLRIPVTVYMVVLVAMACVALLARLPTVCTAAGALLFAGSDAMIGIGRFVLGNEDLAVPVWWTYAAAQVLITAGFFFGRVSANPATPGE